MRTTRSTSSLQWVSIALLLVAVLLLTIQLILFSRSRVSYPASLEIGGVPVGNLTREQAAQRLLEIFTLPVELHYQNSIIMLDPTTVGFEINLESMLAAADLERTGGPFWNEFWGYLWGSHAETTNIPLDISFSEPQLREYLLNEIASRYDKPAVPAQPLPGTVIYDGGENGTTINIDSSVVQIESALKSSSRRVVNLPLVSTLPSRPSFLNLEIFLKQTLDLNGFDGIAGFYLYDLQNGQEIHFIYNAGQNVNPDPDLAFTASSIIKIPIMVGAYRALGGNPNPEAINLIAGMIEQSGNDPADWLMEQFIDPNRGPLIVTADMQELGLENTFLAGHFRIGSPLLVRFDTEGNSRPDISTDPDPYNQTTVSETGMLLTDIYQCAQNGGGSLVAVFPGEITQSECQDMISHLQRNNTPFLLEAGAPEGTPIAHKHGWVSDATGAITTIGDAGIVYTPSGNYVLVIYFYHPVQLVWEPISTLISDLAKAVYNYYNLSP